MSATAQRERDGTAAAGRKVELPRAQLKPIVDMFKNGGARLDAFGRDLTLSPIRTGRPSPTIWAIALDGRDLRMLMIEISSGLDPPPVSWMKKTKGKWMGANGARAVRRFLEVACERAGFSPTSAEAEAFTVRGLARETAGAK